MVGKEKQSCFGGIDSEDASKLVGGVVEKGFSEEGKTSNPINTLPAPSVLPFPVARHRSHGPVNCSSSIAFLLSSIVRLD
ncbi:hypothetical protein LIER_41362 [Lithospermum erythrorhizon]|uniref:Uncharacterized protein n=1 Tax=Lithospermum erythrorhizon TaxID=34254 RepID=A0AAV3RDZ7_LITER